MRLLLKLGLLLGLVCMAGFAEAQSPVTLYFTDTAYGTNIWQMTATSPTGAVSSTTITNAASTTGWYSLIPGFANSTRLASEPATSTPGMNTIWISEGTYNGTFAAGNWVFTIRKTDNRSGRIGAFHADIYTTDSTSDQTGTHATFIAHCSDAADDWTGAAATITATCTTAGTTTVTNKYLAVRTLQNVTTGSTSSGTWTMTIKDSVNGLSKLVTPNYTYTPVTTNKAGAAAPNFACTAEWCKETTSNFTQPSLNLATTVAASRTVRADVAASLNFNNVGNGVRPGTGKTGAGSASLNFACAACTELIRSFTQPTLNLAPAPSVQRTLYRSASASFGMSTTATGEKPGTGIFNRNASVNFNLALQSCDEITRSLASPNLGLATAVGFAMDRSFPDTTFNLATSAAAVKTLGVITQVGNANASISLATAATRQRLLNRVGAATINLATVDTKLARLNKPDNASVGFATSVTARASLGRGDAASVGFATAVGVRRDLNRALASAPNFATTVKTQRFMNVGATASLNFATGVSGNPNGPKYGPGAASFGFQAVPTINTVLHVAANVSFGLNTTNPTGVRTAASTRRVLVIGVS